MTAAATVPTGTAAPPLTVGVLHESGAGERRVALTPDGVKRLLLLGCRVVIEAGAGVGAGFDDAAYTTAGATVADAAAVCSKCAVLVCIGAPADAQLKLLRAGQTLIGLLQPAVDAELMESLTAARVTVISLDGLPRTLSSAQSMDALTSQANVAGYKAAIVAANAYGSYLPMLMTAAGTVRPAKVLVIGAGVAGLQAIGTARRLGAVVTGYDVRDAARSDVASTGAAFLNLDSAVSATASGGYARQLTAAEQKAQQDAMATAVGTFDIVITTAQVPGRRPPMLVSTAALQAMRPGSVVVDLAASPLGGNVQGSQPGTTVTTTNAVSIIGAGNLPSTVPNAASTAYSRNIAALLAHLVVAGRLQLDTADEITAGVLITRDGQMVRPAPAVPTLPTNPQPAELVTTGQGPLP